MFKRIDWILLIAALFVVGCGGSTDPGTDTGSGNDNGNDSSSGGPDSGRDSTANLVFGIIGDYGDDDDNSRAVADLMLGWNLDLIITTGDNDYTDGAFRGTFEGLELGVGQYFHTFIGDYRGSSGPGSDSNRFFPTPGDHDWGDTCDDPTGLDDYLEYFTLPDSSGNERYYEFRSGDVHFFAVHAIEDCEPNGTTPDSIQGRWLQAAAAASDAPFKVAYMHKPPYSSADRHIDEGAHMRWPWDAMGFNLVLGGDDHIYERIERDGLVYVVNGLGGVDRHGFVDDPQTGSRVRFADDYGAMRVEVFDQRMEVSFITVAGSTVDTFTIEGPAAPTNGNGSTDGEWYRPAVDATWQWQLQPGSTGTVRSDYDVDVYDIDLFDSDDTFIANLQSDGRHVICYFSAGTFEDFREDAADFRPEDLGNALDDFADERWLDITSSSVRQIMLERLDLAAAKGCDGVEPDNVDGYTNDPGFAFDADDQLDFNRFLADAAHERGLAVGLKNDLDQVLDLVDVFDFSVNEQCHEFAECAALQPFLDAGKPVFNAEYDERYVNDETQREQLCADAREQGLATLVLPLDLDDAFRFSCQE